MSRQTLLPARVEGIRTASPADEKTLRLCDSERHAFLVTMAICGLTYEEIGARIGVTKQAVSKWVGNGVPKKRLRAFCNATGSLLVEQYQKLDAAKRIADGLVRESEQVAAIARHARSVAWKQRGTDRRAA